MPSDAIRVPEEWREWYSRHARALLLLARQHVGSGVDAEDAVQEGFVHFWKSRRRAEDPVAYLFTCVRNAALTLGRRQRTRGRHEQAVRQAAWFEPEPGERAEALAQALEQLPAEQRDVVVLKIWGGLTFGQIGASLGIPLHTAASRYRYALTKLQERVSPEVRHE